MSRWREGERLPAPDCFGSGLQGVTAKAQGGTLGAQDWVGGKASGFRRQTASGVACKA